MTDKKTIIKNEVLNWHLTCENKGISSECLANTSINDGKTGTPVFGFRYPGDNSDFNRCVIFKEWCPNAFEKAKQILKDEPVWKDYFSKWDYMEKLLEGQKNDENDGSELFDLMKDIQKLYWKYPGVAE